MGKWSEEAKNKVWTEEKRLKHCKQMFGEKNPNWKGGIAEYENHCEMKKVRLLKLKEAGGKCEVCSEVAAKVHHIDGSKTNHNMENLAVLCNKCHGIMHTGRPFKTSKYIREYGMTIQEIADKVGVNISTVSRAFRTNSEIKKHILEAINQPPKSSDKLKG